MIKGTKQRKEKIVEWASNNRIHILVWTAFILYETAVVGILFNVFADPLIYLVHYAIIIALFYLHADVVLPKVFAVSKFRGLLVPAVVILQIGLYIVLHYLADLAMISAGLVAHKGSYKLDFPVLARNLYRGVYFMGFSTGYYYLKNYLSERRERQYVENERLKDIIKMQEISRSLADAEHAFLKAQINPHFLFNTLDFIYYHTEKSVPFAAEAILRLSKIMRFAMASGTNETLAGEITQVQHLIYLSQLSSSREQFVNFHFPDNVGEVRFLPLVLLTLVENVFKHGEIYDPENEAVIEVSLSAGVLVLFTDNFPKKQGNSDNKNGAGLANIRRRVELVYGKDAVFTCALGEDGRFRARLQVKLQ